LHAYGVESYGQRSADAYIEAITLAIEQLPVWPLTNRLRQKFDHLCDCSHKQPTTSSTMSPTTK